MSATAESGRPLTPVMTLGAPGWMLAALAGACLCVICFSGLSLMVQWWIGHEEYSYGWLVPPIAAFLAWQKRDELQQLDFRGSWAGVAMVAGGLLLWLLGELSALYTLEQYAFLICLAGTVLAFTGWRAFRTLATALLMLILMVPLPNFINFNLSQDLQLLSSKIGVALIRLLDISVFLEGNVIDLGDYKLQVVEACSGLRYLFPLLTIGFIAAIFFRAPLWKRALLVLSTIPITVGMNSFRIAVIAVLVNQFGPGQAEGFLHDFEGWAIFMACFALLIGEMWLLLRLSGDRRSLRAAFAVDLPSPRARDLPRKPRRVSTQAWAAAALLAAAVVPAVLIPERVEAVPRRLTLAEFPLRLGAWSGSSERMEQEYVNELKFSDYLLANYSRGRSDAVNLYVAYYDSQRKGESVHSPRGCLPGGGWVIESLSQQTVPGAFVAGRPLRTNRVVISQGAQRQLVYYWFQERGRVLTNEYLVKWYLFWDSLRRNRSDGALVRLITAIPTGTAPEHADPTLQDFARALESRASAYVPD